MTTTLCFCYLARFANYTRKAPLLSGSDCNIRPHLNMIGAFRQTMSTRLSRSTSFQTKFICLIQLPAITPVLTLMFIYVLVTIRKELIYTCSLWDTIYYARKSKVIRILVFLLKVKSADRLCHQPDPPQ